MANTLIKDNSLTFPDKNNIRISITGLAICNFDNPKSNIEFLRHVEKHKLKMKVIQKKADDLSVIYSVDYEIGKYAKSISISGAEKIDSHVFKPIRYEEHDLDYIISFKKLHGHELVKNNKPSKPISPPTNLTIENCAFYSAKLTDKKYNLNKFDTDTGEITPVFLEKNFCEVLGGYMTCKDELVITVEGLFQSPIKLPIKIGEINYSYEIHFHNACFNDDGSICKDEKKSKDKSEKKSKDKGANKSKDKNDFAEFYELLKDDVKPHETYDLEPANPKDKGTGTGACLPACTRC